MFRFRHNEVIGVDIGSFAVKIVQLRKSGSRWVVATAGIADIPGTAEGDKNPPETNTVRALRDCLLSTNIQTRRAVCSVSGPEVAVRCFDFPALPAEEISGAVRLEASQVCPFDIDDCAVSYQLTSNGTGNVSGIMVAATKRLMERKRRYAKIASLDTVLMDVDGLALLNCFNEIEKPDSGRTIAILNVGNSCANLMIMGGKSSLLVRDICFPGNQIAEEFKAGEGFSTRTTRKTPPADENMNQPRLELCQSFQKAFQQLVADVNETLGYYLARQKSMTVERVHVCGGFATIEGFVGLLDRQLSAKAVLWDPLAQLSCRAGWDYRDSLSERSPAMAVATGLAMRKI
jgi:type IV pilus assembly protein PilM